MEYEIVLDTETTGFEPSEGHRLVEIGCVELKDKIPTGRTFHKYVNPERDVPQAAFNVHGISTEFLQDKPKFEEVVEEFVEFIKGKRLVIHNADFDVKFLNHELKLSKKLALKNEIFCTLKYSRSKFPGQQNNLDALCKRLGVDNSKRDKHGALLDAEILAEVYLELMGGKQVTFELDKKSESATQSATGKQVTTSVFVPKKLATALPPRQFTINEDEISAHEQLIEKMKNPIWKRNNNAS
jgi:DNA polymerase-3 subunit epsilon